jgi:hypothetical protein
VSVLSNLEKGASKKLRIQEKGNKKEEKGAPLENRKKKGPFRVFYP